LTVGLLHALHAYRGRVVSSQELAEQACEIEIDILGKPIGKQDQYSAAYGGLNLIRFLPNETVDIEPVPARPETMAQLSSWVMLLYTEQSRDANHILQKQTSGTNDKRTVLRAMRDLAFEMRKTISGTCRLEDFAKLLHDGWELKRSLGFGISNE